MKGPFPSEDRMKRSGANAPDRFFVRPDVLCGTGWLLARCPGPVFAVRSGPCRRTADSGSQRLGSGRLGRIGGSRGSGLAGNGCFGCSGDAGVGRIGAGLRDAGLRCGVRFGERFRRVVAGEFERAGRMAALGLEPGRAAQPFADADDVVVARAEAFVGVLVGVAGLALSLIHISEPTRP